MALIYEKNNEGNSSEGPGWSMADEFLPFVEPQEVIKQETNNFYPLLQIDTNETDAFSEYLPEKFKKPKVKYTCITNEKTVNIQFKVGEGLETSDSTGIIDIKPSINDENVEIVYHHKNKTVSLNETIEIEIKFKGEKELEFHIDFFASDNTDDTFDNKGELTSEHCGRVYIQFLYFKDVFLEENIVPIIKEIKEIKKQVEKEVKEDRQYLENYCMQAADRALSKLLNNEQDFFAIERGTHKHLSNVSFMGKTAIQRGSELKQLGYVIYDYSFKGFIINHSIRKEIIDRDSYSNHALNVVSLDISKSILFYNKIIKDIDGRSGYHVYYLSVTKGFHTLLLVIDNRNTHNARYKIYDQHYETSSKGNLSDLMDGIRRQTSWTFANTCLNRVYSGTNQQWDSTETNLFKIQRK